MIKIEKFDVIIVGGGIAGLSAALTAVRHGMCTALVEKENYIGGIAEDCFHTYICGMFKNDNTAPFQIANPGICSDVFKFLYNCYGEKCLVKMGKVETLAFVPRDLWEFFLKHLQQGNFSLFKQTLCTEIVSKGRKIIGIKVFADKLYDSLSYKASDKFSDRSFGKLTDDMPGKSSGEPYKKFSKASVKKLDAEPLEKLADKEEVFLAGDVFIDASGCSMYNLLVDEQIRKSMYCSETKPDLNSDRLHGRYTDTNCINPESTSGINPANNAINPASNMIKPCRKDICSGRQDIVNSEFNENITGNNQLGGYCILLKGKSDKDVSFIVSYTAFKIVKKYKLADYLRFVTINHNFLTGNYILKFSVRYPEDMEKCKFIYQKLNENIKELGELTFVKTSEKIHFRACNKINITDITHYDSSCGKRRENGVCSADDTCDHATANTKNGDNHWNDEICAVKSYWPSEYWDIKMGTRYRYCKKNKPFCIPASAFKDENYDNLFLSGKSIRVSKGIHASARVMGICMATGEQAFINAYNCHGADLDSRPDHSQKIKDFHNK